MQRWCRSPAASGGWRQGWCGEDFSPRTSSFPSWWLKGLLSDFLPIVVGQSQEDAAEGREQFRICWRFVLWMEERKQKGNNVCWIWKLGYYESLWNAGSFFKIITKGILAVFLAAISKSNCTSHLKLLWKRSHVIGIRILRVYMCFLLFNLHIQLSSSGMPLMFLAQNYSI